MDTPNATMPIPATLLAEEISDISETCYSAGWMAGCEWEVWAALTSWRESGTAFVGCSNVSEYMPVVDWLQRQAGGWVRRGDRGIEFVVEAVWRRLVDERSGLVSA